MTKLRHPVGCRGGLILMLVAYLAFGYSMIGIQPPFEGVDETAHLGRIITTAFPPAGNLSAITKTNLPQSIIDYEHHAPMPYGWINFAPLHAHDSVRDFRTYHDFLTDSLAQEIYDHHYVGIAFPADSTPSAQPNWEFQHPPLYYMLMAPLYRLLAGHAPLVTIMMALRLISFTLAMAGLAIGLFATWHHLKVRQNPAADPIVLLGMFYPLLMPEFFWEFARIGNDSLCLFLFGLAWASWLGFIRRPTGDAWIYLALSLGLGCLTKAIMIPVMVGIMLYLIAQNFRGRPASWAPVFKFIALALALVAPVFGGNLLAFGQFGASDFQQGGFGVFLQNLAAHFSIGGFVDALDDSALSAIWVSGSWSRLVLANSFHLGFALIASLVSANYVRSIVQRGSDKLGVLPLWVILPVVVGLIAHNAVMIAYGYDNLTPGYYLHILAPALALVVGLSLNNLITSKLMTRLVVGVMMIAAVANIFILLAHITVFSGCAAPVLRSKTFRLDTADVMTCLGSPQMMLDSLSLMAWPVFALIALWLGLAAMISGFCVIYTASLSRAPPTSP